MLIWRRTRYTGSAGVILPSSCHLPSCTHSRPCTGPLHSPRPERSVSGISNVLELSTHVRVRRTKQGDQDVEQDDDRKNAPSAIERKSSRSDSAGLTIWQRLLVDDQSEGYLTRYYQSKVNPKRFLRTITKSLARRIEIWGSVERDYDQHMRGAPFN
jgi:hypothetical protein